MPLARARPFRSRCCALRASRCTCCTARRARGSLWGASGNPTPTRTTKIRRGSSTTGTTTRASAPPPRRAQSPSRPHRPVRCSVREPPLSQPPALSQPPGTRPAAHASLVSTRARACRRVVAPQLQLSPLLCEHLRGDGGALRRHRVQ
eukprot:1008798-Prymnesium_polylepis.3